MRRARKCRYRSYGRISVGYVQYLQSTEWEGQKISCNTVVRAWIRRPW